MLTRKTYQAIMSVLEKQYGNEKQRLEEAAKQFPEYVVKSCVEHEVNDFLIMVYITVYHVIHYSVFTVNITRWANLSLSFCLSNWPWLISL